jgi:Dolichol phosphate-mannose biosynthesis regulatory protein (DPM2)
MVRILQLPISTTVLMIDQLDKLFGLAMLIIATTVFLYYTIWTLLMVRRSTIPTERCA